MKFNAEIYLKTTYDILLLLIIMIMIDMSLFSHCKFIEWNWKKNALVIWNKDRIFYYFLCRLYTNGGEGGGGDIHRPTRVEGNSKITTPGFFYLDSGQRLSPVFNYDSIFVPLHLLYV